MSVKKTKSKTDLYNTMFAQEDDDHEVSSDLLVKSDDDSSQQTQQKAKTKSKKKHEQEHKQEQKNKQLSHGKGAHKNEDDMIQVQYQVTPPKPTEIDNREYEWALRIKHGAKQKPKLEDIAERRTYWIYKENISYIDEIAEHSGLDKYEVVNMAVQQLYKWMKKQQ